MPAAVPVVYVGSETFFHSTNLYILCVAWAGRNPVKALGKVLNSPTQVRELEKRGFWGVRVPGGPNSSWGESLFVFASLASTLGRGSVEMTRVPPSFA